MKRAVPDYRFRAGRTPRSVASTREPVRADHPPARRADGGHRAVERALAVPGVAGRMACGHRPGRRPGGPAAAGPGDGRGVPPAADPRRPTAGPAHRRIAARRDHHGRRVVGRRSGAALARPGVAGRAGRRAAAAGLRPRAARPVLRPRRTGPPRRTRRTGRLRLQPPRRPPLRTHGHGAAHRLRLRPPRPGYSRSGSATAPRRPRWRPSTAAGGARGHRAARSPSWPCGPPPACAGPTTSS